MNKQNLPMLLLSFLGLILFSSCEVEQIEPAKPAPPVEDSNQQKPDGKTDKDTVTNDQKLEVIGNGSGKLVVKDVSNKRYSIKPGTYSSFHLENIRSTSIEGLGQVTIKSGTIYMSKVNGLSLSGVAIEDGSQPAINI